MSIQHEMISLPKLPDGENQMKPDEYERFLDHFDLETRMMILGTLIAFDPELEKRILTLRRLKPHPSSSNIPSEV